MKCQYHWWTVPPETKLTWKDKLRRRTRWDKAIPVHCEKEAVHHTELGHALEFNMTEVCDEHLKLTLVEEQVKLLDW